METISVHDLLLDRALNPRLHGVDQEVVEFYATIFKEVVWPPILVDRATRKLLDGWHRVEAAKRAGVYTLPVQYVDAQEEELFALAVKANLGHGVRLTREERYRAIARMQREAWTHERIATFLGCSLPMVQKTEKAEDLRIRFKVADHAGAMLPTESLVEVVKLPEEYHHDFVEMICDADAQPSDVRRAVRAVKKGVVESPQEVRRVMTDPDYAKMRLSGKGPTLQSGDWLMTFATLADQLENAQVSISATERDAAVALFKRVRLWADRQLARMGAEETPSML